MINYNEEKEKINSLTEQDVILLKYKGDREIPFIVISSSGDYPKVMPLKNLKNKTVNYDGRPYVITKEFLAKFDEIRYDERNYIK